MALTAGEIERATLLAWPALETIEDGSWTARFAQGYTKRANSVHSLHLADDDRASERIAHLAERYRERGLRPVFRVTPLAGPGIVAALDARADGNALFKLFECHGLAYSCTDPSIRTSTPCSRR